MIGTVLVTVGALAIVLVIALSTTGPTSSHGCIYATIPAATGAQQIHQCGAAARAVCESSQAPGEFTRSAARTIAAECRAAGLPVGRSG